MESEVDRRRSLISDEAARDGGGDADLQVVVDYKQKYARLQVGDEDLESHRADDSATPAVVLNGARIEEKRRLRQRRRNRNSVSGNESLTSDEGPDYKPPPVPNESHNRLAPDIASILPPQYRSAHSGETEETVSSDRLRELIIGDDGTSGDHRALFCELQHLQDSEWVEKARWVRFEEDVEEGGGRWSKPFVATLALHALFELRQSISTGAILLDIEPRSYSELIALIADSLVGLEHLDQAQRDAFIATLHFRHVHQHEHGQSVIKRGLSEIGKKLSSHDTTVTAQLASGLGASAAIASGIAGLSTLPVPTQASQVSMRDLAPHTFNEHFAKKLPPGTEASSTLTGAVEFLSQTVCAFVRLKNENFVLDHLTEVAVPTRFLFILLGPGNRSKDYMEIGRAMGTIMSDDIFRDVAYRSRDRADVLAGLDEFLDEVTILPPGEWDPSIRIQPPKTVPSQDERKIQALNQIAEEQDQQQGQGQMGERNYSAHDGLVMRRVSSKPAVTETSQSQDKTRLAPSGASGAALTDLVLKKQDERDTETAPGAHGMDPELIRTGRIFGGLIADIKRKAPWYLSDLTDALNVQCVASVFYLFFACLAPIVTFGGLLGLATDNNMAAFESILTGAICGTTYHLLSGQPVTILGSTGPVLLFEKILFAFTRDYGFNYLTMRFWTGMWASAFLMLIVMFDLSSSVALITRFTEECFATLISVIFIYEAFTAVYGIYKAYPISNPAMLSRNYSCWCDWKTVENSANMSQFSDFNCQDLNLANCTASPCQPTGPGCGLKPPVPDVFFFSCLVFFATCFLSMQLKAARTTPFFPNKVRSIISDFAVSISIFIMVTIDFLIDLPTPKLRVPEEFAPTRHDRGWLVEPLANPIWTVFAAALPAILLAVLLFMDQQITAVIVNRKEHKLTKGKGYHLDLFILTCHVGICATFGLPYFVAATVLSITHVNSLRKQSETSAPGEQPKFLGLIEQRVTGFVVFALIGCAIPLRGILKFIPMPVLYGVFLFMGLSALQTSQFYQRVLLFFMPVKYQPDAPYLRHMKTWRVHLFTIIQLTAFIGLWVIKNIKSISILFILMLVVMVILRKLLDFVFTQEELKWVDDILPKNPLAVPSKSGDHSNPSAKSDEPKEDGANKKSSPVNQVRQASVVGATAAEKQPLNSNSTSVADV